MQFQRTVTSGIVSAINRTIGIQTEQGENYMEGLIQTDASINPGNSGGPLLDADGKVIGINTIKVSTAEGMGFAIPIDLCKPIIKGFTEEGNYETPYMGVFAHDGDIAEYVSQKFSDGKGIHVTKIDENGPAYRGGLRVGDIIKKVNGKEVKSMADLRENICCSKPGDKCELDIIRDSKSMKINFSLGTRQNDFLITR
jgi:S1-C subfamily serine protease